MTVLATELQIRLCSQCPHGWLNPLAELSPEAQRAIAQERRVKHFPHGAVLAAIGEPITELLCLSSGAAKAVLPERSSQQLLVGLFKPGDVIGLRDLFGERRHTVNVIALEEVTACSIPAELVLEHAHASPNFWLRLVQLLTQQLEHVEGQFFVLQSRSLRERLLALLRVLLQTYGLDEQQRLRCRLPLSELATLLRSSVPAVRRALSALQGAQLLRLQGDYLVVANPQALERLLE